MIPDETYEQAETRELTTEEEAEYLGFDPVDFAADDWGQDE